MKTQNTDTPPAGQRASTPTPWTISPHTGRVVMSGETRICEANVPNAALIVEAVNQHAALLSENGRLKSALANAADALGDCARQFKGHNMIASFDVAKVYWLEARAALTPSATNEAP